MISLADSDLQRMIITKWGEMLTSKNEGGFERYLDICSGAPFLKGAACIAAICLMEVAVVERLLNSGLTFDNYFMKELLTTHLDQWFDFVVNPSCATVVDLLIRAMPKLGSPALVAAISACEPVICVRLLDQNVSLDRTCLGTLLQRQAEKWAPFVRSKLCGEAVDRLIKVSPTLGPPALTIAVMERDTLTFTRLVVGGVALDERARQLLLNHSDYWRTLVLDASSSSFLAVDRCIHDIPLLGPLALSAAISARQPSTVIRLLDNKVKPDEESLRTTEQIWRNFVLDKSCGGALVRCIANSCILGGLALVEGIKARDPTTVAQLLDASVILDEDALETLLDADAKLWRAFVLDASCEQVLDRIITIAPSRLGPLALSAAILSQPSPHSAATVTRLLDSDAVLDTNACDTVLASRDTGDIFSLEKGKKHLTRWQKFAFTDFCAEPLERIIKMAPALGPPVLAAAIAQHNLEFIRRLIGFGATLDDGTCEELLKHESWRDFCLSFPDGHEDHLAVLDLVVATARKLGPTSLVVAISKKSPSHAIRLMCNHGEYIVSSEVRQTLLAGGFWHRLVQRDEDEVVTAIAAIAVQAPELMAQKDDSGRKAYALAVQRVKLVRFGNFACLSGQTITACMGWGLGAAIGMG